MLADREIGRQLARARYVVSADDILAVGDRAAPTNRDLLSAGTAPGSSVAVERHF